MKKRFGQRAAAIASVLTVLSGFCFPLQAWAASPPFAYTEEEWALLRDDILEFSEIENLVHEYNTTVKQNAISYKDYQGKDSNEIAQEYYDAAEEIYDSQPDLDPDSSSYASDLSSYIKNEQTADSMKESGDSSVDDEDTIKWGYTQEEKELVSQAQELVISYWNSMEKLSALRQELYEAQRNETSLKTKAEAGMATQSEVLTAGQAVLTAQSEITSAESTLEKTKNSLILMLGWDYGDSVEIKKLPEPDLESIDCVQLENDLNTAAENNYDLKILKKQLQNARSSSVEASVREKTASGEKAVRSNVTTAYQSLMLARNQYIQAVNSLSLKEQELETAKRKKEAGLLSENNYQTTVSSCETAESEKQTAAYSLLAAKLEYDWQVGGLASAS